MKMAVEMVGPNLVESLNVLFYFSTFAGVTPYSPKVYFRQKVLQISLIGNVFCVVATIHSVVQYHMSSLGFSMGENSDSGTLTVIIGIVIIYMEPVMLVVDVVGFLFYQKRFINLLDRMQKVDDKLLKENIKIEYKQTKRLTIILIIIVTVIEFGLVLYNFLLFQEVVLESIWWFVTGVPLYLSSATKIWYITLVFNVKQKFTAINDHFESTGLFFEELKKRISEPKEKSMMNEIVKGGSQFDIGLGGYLHREINAKPSYRKNQIKMMPSRAVSNLLSSNDGVIQVLPIDHVQSDSSTPFNNVLNGDNRHFIESKITKQMTGLCELHDEICDIGKAINQMFSFQMLILMAYGFMSLTAQFYFVYCGMTEQTIPILFRSAENLPVSIAFIIYTGAKCVYVIYMSWQTKLVAQKTGVKIHKVANIVDEDQCYQVVNHLSLKLLNHHLSFTACGFFELDMTTLYAITGAITSYLIILIQFNLAAQRNRKSGTPGNGTISTNITSAGN